MKPQNIIPTAPRATARPLDPCSFFVARARMVCHLGESRCRKLGVRFSSGIEHVHELAGGVLSCETEEDVLESGITMRRGRPQISHRPQCANLSVLDDSDPVAHCFRDL